MSRWSGKDNPGHKRKLAIQCAVEREFGEPLADTIVGLREQGNSWRTVAGALGVSTTTLLVWRKELGLPHDKHDNVRDPSSEPQWTPTDEKARRLGFENARNAIIHLRLVEKLQLIEVAELLDCHVNTVCRYTPSELRGVLYYRSESWWRVRRRQAARMTELSVAARKRDGHLFHALNDEVFEQNNTTR